MKDFFRQNRTFFIVATVITILGLAKVKSAHATTSKANQVAQVIDYKGEK